MENKKTIIGIIIVTILIIALVVLSYLYNDFNNKQLNILKDETNNLLQANIITEEINSEIKSDKNFAKVEEAIKEYVSELKNIYIKTNNMYSEMSPNDIFSAKNLENGDMQKVDEIINEYKEKCKENISEYKELIKEEKILQNIEKKDIKVRKGYYTDLYKTVMLSDSMKKQYESLENAIDKKEEQIYNKLDKLEKIKKYLSENQKYWTIKEDKIQFNNINRMTEYYNLVNEFIS